MVANNSEKLVKTLSNFIVMAFPKKNSVSGPIVLSAPRGPPVHLRGFTKGWLSKRVFFGGCSPATKTGTRVHSDAPPERKPERGYVRMFPRNQNRNEGAFAKTTLLRNAPFCLPVKLASQQALASPLGQNDNKTGEKDAKRTNGSIFLNATAPESVAFCYPPVVFHCLYRFPVFCRLDKEAFSELSPQRFATSVPNVLPVPKFRAP